MGGWSGGVYSRFRNWVTDKSNSINPQAALFDQEDDGFAAGLNNCVTKDGLNKPSSAMDWNGQNLTGVLNFANTGTVSLANGKLTISLNGNIVGSTVTSGSALSLTGLQINKSFNLSGPNTGVGWNLAFSDTTNTVDRGFIGLGTNTVAGAAVTDFAIVPGPGGRIVIGDANGAHIACAFTSAGQTQITDDSFNLFRAGYMDAPQNLQTINYQLVIADRGKSVQFNGVGPLTCTIPANASVAFPIGTIILIINNTSSNLTLAITTDGLFLAGTATGGNGVSRTIAANGIASLYKLNSAGWFVSGPGVT